MSSEKRVVELDGARSGPLDRGACTDLLRVSPAPAKQKLTSGYRQSRSRKIHGTRRRRRKLQPHCSRRRGRVIRHTTSRVGREKTVMKCTLCVALRTRTIRLYEGI
jgi:hypothetical protein